MFNIVILSFSIKIGKFLKNDRNKTTKVIGILRKGQLDARPKIRTRHNVNKAKLLLHNHICFIITIQR